MSWERNSLYDRYKDRRNGRLFFLALLGIIGFFPMLGLVGLICQNLFPDYPDQMLLAMGATACLFLFALLIKVCRMIAASKRRRRERVNLSELSSDERAKARSKLLQKQNRVNL